MNMYMSVSQVTIITIATFLPNTICSFFENFGILQIIRDVDLYAPSILTKSEIEI